MGVPDDAGLPDDAALPDEVDVAIVGYGPVGQLLAIQLGRAGHRVAVLERWPEFYAMPRAVHFDDEVGRILQSVGLRPDESSAIEPYDALYAWRNAAMQDLLVLNWSATGRSGWNTSNFFVQPQLEAQLDELVRAQPTVSLHRGCEVVAVTDHGDRTEVVVGKHGTLTARYVIGADGANSFVRTAMGVEVEDLGFYFDWLIVDLTLHEPRTFDPPAWQLCDPARPTTLVPGGPGRRRWEFMRLPGETREELNAPERAWELLAPWDVHPGNATLERRTVYTFQARWAREWRRGRLLIAGDAAHLMPPFAGQGMCAGLRDATNLAWKLDLVLRGLAGDAVLDTYGPERTPHVRHFIEESMALGRVICITDPDEAAARDARMLAAQADPSLAPPPPPPPRLGRGPLVPDDEAAGFTSIQAPVPGGLFDDVAGVGALVVRPGVGLDPARTTALARVGLAVASVGPGGDHEDLTGAYTAWFDSLGADAVLVRPDFAVFGAVRAGGVEALVDGFLGALRSSDSAVSRTPADALG